MAMTYFGVYDTDNFGTFFATGDIIFQQYFSYIGGRDKDRIVQSLLPYVIDYPPMARPPNSQWNTTVGQGIAQIKNARNTVAKG